MSVRTRLLWALFAVVGLVLVGLSTYRDSLRHGLAWALLYPLIGISVAVVSIVRKRRRGE